MMTYTLSEKMKKSLPSKIDHVIVCSSYENRCLSMYDFLEPHQVNKFSIFYFKQFKESTANNLDKYVHKFSPKTYELDNSRPTSIADAIVDVFSDSSEEKMNVIFDISTFTREALLIILKYFEIHRSMFNDVFLYYRAANVADSLSSGLIQIRNVIGYLGKLKENKPLHLIVLSGFEHERAKDIIDMLEPDTISIGYGSPEQSISKTLQNKNDQFTKRLAAYYSDDNIKIFEHSLVDPFIAKNQILSIVDKIKDHNIVIIPLNNKLSTVAVGLAAQENDEIQVCYSQMGSYNTTSYSEEIDECFIFNLFNH